MSKKKKKFWLRAVTLIMGLGFVGSSLAIALSSVFSQSNYSAEQSQTNDAAAIEEQIQMQVRGYEKVLEREPNNLTALQGLAQIHLQTGNTAEAIPILEKLVEYYPEQPEFASILQLVEQQANQEETEPIPQAQPETE